MTLYFQTLEILIINYRYLNTLVHLFSSYLKKIWERYMPKDPKEKGLGALRPLNFQNTQIFLRLTGITENLVCFFFVFFWSCVRCVFRLVTLYIVFNFPNLVYFGWDYEVTQIFIMLYIQTFLFCSIFVCRCVCVCVFKNLFLIYILCLFQNTIA